MPADALERARTEPSRRMDHEVEMSGVVGSGVGGYCGTNSQISKGGSGSQISLNTDSTGTYTTKPIRSHSANLNEGARRDSTGTKLQ